MPRRAVIGRMLFEFGHLEMELALDLVSGSDNGSNLEAITNAIFEDALHAKLCRLKKRANAKGPAQASLRLSNLSVGSKRLTPPVLSEMILFMAPLGCCSSGQASSKRYWHTHLAEAA